MSRYTIALALLLAAGALAQEAALTAESQVRVAAEALREALAGPVRTGLVARVSPASRELVAAVRRIGRAPEIGADEATQLELLLGYEAYASLGPARLARVEEADLLAWVITNRFSEVDQHLKAGVGAVVVQHERAEAQVGKGRLTTKSPRLIFGRHEGTWRLELRDLLGAVEPALAAVRAERGVTRAELAARLVEQGHGRELPALRLATLEPKDRARAQALLAAGPTQAVAAVQDELAAGRQDEAEMLLAILQPAFTNDQRLAFVRAVCKRSRFYVQEGARQFARVLAMKSDSVEGRCARCVLDLDAQEKVDASFAELDRLAAAHPDDPYIHWMIGVMCRDHYRETDRTDRSEAGARAYARVLELFPVAPVLVYQTYANILSEELGRDEEALPHRRKAVELSPAPWSYQGLANTLSRLKRYPEANAAFATLVELAPDDADYWASWANSLFKQREWTASIEKCQAALERDPRNAFAHNVWGAALVSMNRLEEGLAQYRKAIHDQPHFALAYDNAAQVLDRLERKDEAEAMRKAKEKAMRGAK